MIVAVWLACAPKAPESAADLVGTWANHEDATWRVWRFEATDSDGDPDLAGQSDVYHIFVYGDAEGPIEVQQGTYGVEDGVLVNTDAGEEEMDGVLVTTVTASIDGVGVGQTFGDPFYAWTGDSFTIRSASAASGKRTYEAVNAMP